MGFLIETFLEALSAEHGASKNTLEAYGRDLRDFQVSLGDKNLQLAESNDIRAHLERLHHRALEPRTIARHLSSLRHFYRFLQEQQDVKKNPALDIEMPKVGKRLPKALTADEMKVLVQTAYEKEGPDGVRIVCLLELLYATGLRVSELISLPYNTVIAALKTDQSPLPLIVRGKGNKERLVLLSETSVKALKNYLRIYSVFDPQKNNQWLFSSSSQQGYLTRQRFGQLLKELAVKAGIDMSKVSPHVIRHAFASHMLNNGADLLSLQSLLGHSSIATTEIYTHVLEEHLEKAVLQHHPLSTLQKKTNTV